MIAIAFTGQDGTGKSTQLGLLREALRAKGLKVGVVHQYGPTTGIGRRALPWAKRVANRSMRASGDTGGPTTDRAPRPASLLRHAAAALSLTLGCGRSLRNRLAYRDADVLILDRYFTDEIIRARHKFDSGRRLGGWLLRCCVPRPAVAITFTLDDRTGWERKKTRELTLEEYRRKVAVTRETLRDAGTIWHLVSIPVDGLTPDEVFERVRESVEEQLATSA